MGDSVSRSMEAVLTTNFPAHEMYMNGNLLTRWDPAIRGNNVFNLFDSAPSRRATINESFYP